MSTHVKGLSKIKVYRTLMYPIALRTVENLQLLINYIKEGMLGIGGGFSEEVTKAHKTAEKTQEIS